MFYTIYKTTNKINGKYYIGKHQTTDLNDNYLGSGKLLKRAIKKYGVENFSKEILFVFDNEEQMNVKEKDLVVVSEETYNLCPGGHGGFGYINENNLNNKNHEHVGKILSVKNKNIKRPYMSEIMKKRHKEGLVKYDTFTGKTHTAEWKVNHSKIMKSEISKNKGIPRSAETKEKIRKSLLGNVISKDQRNKISESLKIYFANKKIKNKSI